MKQFFIKDLSGRGYTNTVDELQLLRMAEIREDQDAIDWVEGANEGETAVFEAMEVTCMGEQLGFFSLLLNEGEEDQNSCTFAEFIRANTDEDGGLCEEFAQIADLHIGQSITLGGGAAPTYTVKRIS